MDRIDLRVEVPSVSPGDLIRSKPGEPSASVAKRVLQARQIQTERYQEIGLSNITVNAHCPIAVLDQILFTDDGATSLIADAADKMKFSARGYHRILKVARTLADLDASNHIKRIHVAEAISYRIAGEQLLAAA